MRVRTLTNSSNETPTCVTSLKRRSRKLSQQMLALLSAHSASKDEHEEHLKSVQTESQSWLSPMVSRATLTTVGTMNGLSRLALDRNNSGDMVEYYAGSDGQRDVRSTGYPPQLHSGQRSRAQRAGHTPQSSYSSSKYSREAPKQASTSPTKPIGPRAPNQLGSVRTIDGHSNSKRRPLGISTDAHDSRRVQLAEFSAECSPDSSSAALSLRNLAQSAPSTSRYPPESQLNSFPAARGGLSHNTRPAVVATQDMYPTSYPTSPITPASAPAYTTPIRTPQPPRSKSTADRGKAPTRTLPASPPQASPLHSRAMSSDGITGGIGSHIEPRLMQAHAQGGTGGSSARPRTPRDIGNVDGTTHRPEHADHAKNASGQSSGSDYSESGQYAIIDHPNPPPQQQQHQSAEPVAQEYRDLTSFDVGTDVDSRPVAASFSLSPPPRPHPPRVQTEYFQPQPQPQPAPTSNVSVVRLEGGTTKANARISSQGADLRGSIADLWTSAVTAAEEDFRLEQLQKSNGPLSATSIVSAPSQMGSSGAVTSEPSSTPGGSVPIFSSGLSSRPGSRGRENQPQPQIPQIVHSNSSSSHGHSHGYRVPLSIPPVPTLHAGPLPSPPHHIAVKPIFPPPPRPARNVTYGPVSVVPSNPTASASVSASAHGSASSIALKRPPGSREPSPHKQRSHTPPSPARPPPPPLARSPSPSKSPPPPPPAKSVPPSPPLPPPPSKSVPPPIPPVPAPRETSSQSPIKPTIPLPLSTSPNSTNTSATANSKSTKSLSVFARSPTSPVKPPIPLPPTITSISNPAPAPAPAAPVPSSLVDPPVSLPDPTMKPRPRSPPPPPPFVKPLQLPMKSSNNNSPLPPPPTQLPSVPLPATGKENSRENAHIVARPQSRGRLALSRADSDYSIVAVSVKSGTTEEGTAAGHEETKHGKVEAEAEVEVEVLQSVDKEEGRVESSESEYSGSESHESKVTSSTVAVVPIPSKLDLGDTPADRSTGSLHIREAAESISPQLHRVVNVSVERPEVTTPTKVASTIEELDATPTRGNLASAGNLGKAGPPAPAPAPNFLRRKEEVAHPDGRFAVYQRPPISQPLEELKVELRPISLGFMKDEDFVFHLSEAEPASNLTFGVPKRLKYDQKDVRPQLYAPSPKRSKSGKRPPVAVKNAHPGGHTRKENMSSSGSEYEKGTLEHRPRPKEEKKTAVRSPDFFGNPFATPSSSSRPTTADTTTTESESAIGHGNLLGWEPLPRKRNIRAEREAFKRTTIVARFVDGSNLGHGVEGDVEDADEDDDDEFEVETEHGRVLRKLVKEKSSWPPAMSFRDVISESTTAARARGYATKINELAQEDCGLKDWIEIWLKPKLFAGQLDIQPAGVSAHGRVASGASVFSDTTFPMRFDAFRAIDLTPGAGGGPTELGNGPPPLPYPSLAMKQLQYGNAHRVKSNANASNNLLPIPKKSARILSNLARKASMKSKAAGDTSGQENREKERVRRKLYRAPPSGSISDIGHSSSRASLVPLTPSIIGGPRALPVST